LPKKKKMVRVFGHVDVVVSTVVWVEEGATPEAIFELATKEFKGISQLVGNGGCGDKLIGVNGPEDTIIADEAPTFDDYMEEV